MSAALLSVAMHLLLLLLLQHLAPTFVYVFLVVIAAWCPAIAFLLLINRKMTVHTLTKHAIHHCLHHCLHFVFALLSNLLFRISFDLIAIVVFVGYTCAYLFVLLLFLHLMAS